MRTGSSVLKAATAALAAMVSMAVTPTLAQTISNTATLEWTAGAATVARNSNRVDLVVERAATTPSLATFQFSGAANAERLSVPDTICRGSGGDVPVVLEGAYAGTPRDPASVERTTTIRAGEPLIIGITSVADNLDPNIADTLTVTLGMPAVGNAPGDSETLVLRETGVNTNLFVGVIRTSAVPPDPTQGDCQLSIHPGDRLQLGTERTSNGNLIATVPVDVLVDPFGIVFDSADGKPIAGARVTLIDDATGQPAIVFGDDATSRFPSTIVTSGTPVTDSSGTSYTFPPGDYRFPFVRPGRYRLLVEPPTPYTAPSLSTPAELAGLLRPDGQPFKIFGGSYGQPFVITDPTPVRIDIPLDRPGGALQIRKTASSAVAVPGDAVQYRITITSGDAARASGTITVNDRLPPQMRLQPNTVRYNGQLTAYSVSDDGRDLTVTLAPLAPRASGTLTYLLEVRPDAQPGQSMNRAQARDSRGTVSPVADAMVRIARDGLSDRMTIIGRVTDGGCAVDPDKAEGVGGVRIMLEDGSYAVTDPDGRYHFEGVLPGTHVVQMSPETLGANLIPANCARNARSGGSAISRFVDGQGGALVRVDFRAQAGINPAHAAVASLAPRPKPLGESAAAGADRDWFEGQAPGIAWLFPTPDHNPRTRAVRVAIKHLTSQSVALFVEGKPVSALALDGTRKNGDVAITAWRAVDLGERDTHLSAEVRDANGIVVERLDRVVHYASSAIAAQIVHEKSILIADGVTRPVIAVRMTDRDDRPVHHGVVGDFALPAPYYPAVEADAQAARQLAGLERARPVWRVEGDDGIAYIELEPTTASGALSITLPFRDGQVTRTQRVETWLEPGSRPWTVVGFAAGTAGFNTLKGRLEGLGADGEHWLTDARVALYAKGRIKGKWLLTLAYDSDKDVDETRFGGVIDPQSYYTIYADRSDRRFDAASVRKLYVRLERPQFYALFGDFETGMVEPQLTRYVRSFNGAKAQYRSESVSATAFTADTPYRHRREEIQGNGLTGPYALGARDILPNSERITIEVRDRLRSNRIIETKRLVRHIDYDVDYVAGLLRFREPVLSRSSLLDPQVIIADYEVDGVGQRVLNAGGRATWRNPSKTLILGASAIHDESDVARTNVGGIDLRYTPNAATEIRAELAHSSSSAVAGAAATGQNASAGLIEVEHHGKVVDLLAYARRQEAGFGVGQLNAAETGTEKLGFDGRLRVTPDLSLVGSGWQERYLGTLARRQAAQARVEYRTKGVDLRAGLMIASDRLADGRDANSTVAQFGATKRFFGNRLELDAQTEFALGGNDASIDVPARHRLGARLAVTSDVSLVGSYEIATGENIDARTARIGFDLKPWTGAKLVASANQQSTGEYGPRSFAAYGLSQSLPIGKRWTVDFTLDGNKTLGGIDRARVLAPAQPVASGGFLGSAGTLTEDFTAVTAGATYRGDRWSLAGRIEARAGDRTDRYGLNLSVLRQLGEGRAFGGAFGWFRANEATGQTSESTSLALSWANRPDDSRWAWLEQLELRRDAVENAVAGLPGPIGGAPLLVTGNASTARVINSLSVNWSPVTRAEGRYLGRSEISLFWGTRYVADKIDQDDLSGWSNVVGADIRFDLGEKVDIGVAGTVRESAGGRAISYSGGPSVSLSPFENSYITLGYNVVGFHDRDYVDTRYTRSGPFVTLRLKFDQNSLGALGLGRRR